MKQYVVEITDEALAVLYSASDIEERLKGV